MYAIVLTGGKQYKVSENDVFNAEKLEVNVGDKVSLKPLMIVDGEKSYVSEKDLKKYVVEAEVVEQGKAPKVIVFKYKAKKNERKRQGHRQPFTKLKILSIKKI